MRKKDMLFLLGLMLISLFFLASCSQQNFIMGSNTESFEPYKNEFYTFDALSPFVHYGSGTNTIINGQLNMLEVSGSTMDFEYLSNTDYLDANYKRIESDFVISDSLVDSYNSAVLTLDAQRQCGETLCYFTGYNSCWEQLFDGVWYLGIYQCNNYQCSVYDTIASDSGHAFTQNNNYRMVFERNGGAVSCVLYDNDDLEVSSVSGSVSTYLSGYDGLMSYYANVTFDNTNMTWTNGFVGECINATYLGGLMVGCND
jgi:hypothetical protein